MGAKKSIVSSLLIICLITESSISYAAGRNIPTISPGIDFSESTETGSVGGAFVGSSIIAKRLISEYKFKIPRVGHGFAAERANSFIDSINLLENKKAKVVGDENIKNGVDRIVTDRYGKTTLIQDKYYQTASQSIDACFDENGVFRYLDGKNKPMQIEVPKDQYTEAMKEMEKKFSEGKLPQIKSAKEARGLVKQGKITYKQAINLTKAGNITSLKYDAAHGTIAAGATVGISCMINVAIGCINGNNIDDVLKDSALDAIKTGGLVFASSVIAGQLSRAGEKGAVRVFKPAADAIAKRLGTKVSEALVKSAAESGTKVTTEAVSKVLANKMLSNSVVVVVFAVPDVVKFFKGKISTEQLITNLISLGAGVAGWEAGAMAGGAIGTAIAPGIGSTIGGVVGGIAGGVGASLGSDALLKNFYEGDAEKMMGIIEKEFADLCNEYLVSEKEAGLLTDALKKKLDGDALEDMYSSDDQKKYARSMIESLIVEQIHKREKVKEPSQEELRNALKADTEGIVFVH